MNTEAIQNYNNYFLGLVAIFQGLLKDEDNYRSQIRTLESLFSEEQYNEYHDAFVRELYQNLDEYDDDQLIFYYLRNNLAAVSKCNIGDRTKEVIVKQNFEIRYLVNLHKQIMKSINEYCEIIEWDEWSNQYSMIVYHRRELKQMKENGTYPFPDVDKEKNELSDNQSVSEIRSVETDAGNVMSKTTGRTQKSKLKGTGGLVPKICWEDSEDAFHHFFAGLIDKQVISLDGDFDRQVILEHLADTIHIQAKGGNRFRRSDDISEVKLHWHDTPQMFVSHFFDLIDRKTLSYRSEYDMAPIVKELHAIFHINMKRQKGVVKLSSLQTYFKKHKLGDPF